MNVFRRRQADTKISPPVDRVNVAAEPPARPALPDSTTRRASEMNVPPHIERALITLTTKMQRCVERLDILEHRIDELAEAGMNTPSHSDVLEVRLHSAKLAAELARTTVELRGEIGLASEETRRQWRSSRNHETPDIPASLPVDVGIEKASRVDVAQDRDDPPDWSQSA